MGYKTCIVLLSVDASHSGRKMVERVENGKFDYRSDIENAMIPKSYSNVEHVKLCHAIILMDLTDFMDACNNSDDGAPEDEKIDLAKFWVGYVHLKE